MITAKLTRNYFNSRRTLGKFELFDNGVYIFGCYTCEDTVRGNGDAATVEQWKIKGESAVPYGVYKCRYTRSSRFSRERGRDVFTWQLMDVTGFDGIRIHSGNTEKDTEGCILLGYTVDSKDYGGVSNSRKAVSDFENIMAKQESLQFQLEILK